MAALFTGNHNYFILGLGVFFSLLIIIFLFKILRTKANKNSSSIKKSKEISFIPNFALEDASDMLVLGRRGAGGKHRHTRRVRRGFTPVPMLPMTNTDDVSANANFGFIKSDKKDNSKIDANTLAAISAAISYYKRARKRG